MMCLLLVVVGADATRSGHQRGPESNLPKTGTDRKPGDPNGCRGADVDSAVVAGRIREDDITEVREKARIDDVVSSYVTLRKAGGGSLKGLCPFHDEKSPSFNVNPSRGYFHCFGCGEGGDVISFVQKIDHLSFSEAVELLAGRANVELHYEDDSGRATGAPDRANVGQRARLSSS